MVRMKQQSLKKSLSSAQARLKKKKEAEDAAAQKQVKSGTAQAIKPRRSTIPFKASDRILLIGEGNFSFALALLQHPPAPLDHLLPANITATALDTEKECNAKYPDAEENVRVLREKGAQVLFGVDATKLEKTSALKGKVFDRIVWNFPHAGECVPMTCMRRADRTKGKGITDQDRNILSNQILILGFLRSAARYLVHGPIPQIQPSRKRKRPSSDDEGTDGDDDDQVIDGRARGTILITLRNVPPYTEWSAFQLLPLVASLTSHCAGTCQN